MSAAAAPWPQGGQLTPALVAARHDRHFQRFLARTCGTKVRSEESGFVVEGIAWRGHVYVTSSYQKQP